MLRFELNENGLLSLIVPRDSLQGLTSSGSRVKIGHPVDECSSSKYICDYDVAFPPLYPVNVPRARQRWDRTLRACHHPLVLIAVRPGCVLSICPGIQPARKVAQHELKENGPERCLMLAQDENLIGPCAYNRGCMTARLRCALTSLLAEKARRGE